MHPNNTVRRTAIATNPGCRRHTVDTRRRILSDDPARPILPVLDVHTCHRGYRIARHESCSRLHETAETAWAPDGVAAAYQVSISRRASRVTGRLRERPCRANSLRHRYGAKPGGAVFAHLAAGENGAQGGCGYEGNSQGQERERAVPLLERSAQILALSPRRIRPAGGSDWVFCKEDGSRYLRRRKAFLTACDGERQSPVSSKTRLVSRLG